MERVADQWIMRGISRNDPDRIRSWRELTGLINKIGFIPLFANEAAGFSVEEMVTPFCWWTGDSETDPWMWREIIAGEGDVAYGNFFDNKAGFISREWFPYFANALRDGYDFPIRKPIGDGVHNVINALWYGMKLAMNEMYSILGT